MIQVRSAFQQIYTASFDNVLSSKSLEIKGERVNTKQNCDKIMKNELKKGSCKMNLKIEKFATYFRSRTRKMRREISMVAQEYASK